MTQQMGNHVKILLWPWRWLISMCLREIPQCSAECGRGNRTRSTVCLMDHVTDLPLASCEGERPPEVTPCDSGPCQNRLEWYAGPWGQVIYMHRYTHHPVEVFPLTRVFLCACVCMCEQCSAECGNGTQTRSVACIFNNNGHMEVVDNSKCSSLSQPITAQVCRLKPCGVQWYVTEWSVVSVLKSVLLSYNHSPYILALKTSVSLHALFWSF